MYDVFYYRTHFSIDDCIGLLSRKNIYDLFIYKFDKETGKMLIYGSDKTIIRTGLGYYRFTFSESGDQTLIKFEYLWAFVGQWQEQLDKFLLQKLDAVRADDCG